MSISQIHIGLWYTRRSTLARPFVGVNRKRSLMSLSLLLLLGSRMSCSSYLNGFCVGGKVAVQLLFCRVLLPRFVQNNA